MEMMRIKKRRGPDAIDATLEEGELLALVSSPVDVEDLLLCVFLVVIALCFWFFGELLD